MGRAIELYEAQELMKRITLIEAELDAIEKSPYWEYISEYQLGKYHVAKAILEELLYKLRNGGC